MRVFVFPLVLVGVAAVYCYTKRRTGSRYRAVDELRAKLFVICFLLYRTLTPQC